jgi:hypothetical protein
VRYNKQNQRRYLDWEVRRSVDCFGRFAVLLNGKVIGEQNGETGPHAGFFVLNRRVESFATGDKSLTGVTGRVG